MLLSLALIILGGLLADHICRWLKAPGLVGMVLLGILLGPHGLGLLDDVTLAASADVRLLALIVILLRAGLGLDRSALRRVGGLAVKMSALPCLLEGGAVAVAAHLLLSLAWVDAAILGFVLAAVTPAVVVPAVIRLRERGLGAAHGVHEIILAASSVDDVFAITLFTIFLGLRTGASSSIWLQLGSMPLQIIGGAALGALLGLLLAAIVNWRQVGFSSLEHLALMLALALVAVLLGEELRVAGLLAVMTLGFVLLQRADRQALAIERSLGHLWFFAQIALFVLIGAEVNLQVAWRSGFLGLAVVLVGLAGRALGVLAALAGSHLSWRERLFCIIAFAPKATVQAAVGGIPLAAGLAAGPLILAVAVLAIVLTAPLGALGIEWSAPRLLTQNPPQGPSPS